MNILQALKNVSDGIFLSTKQSTMVWISTKKEVDRELDALVREAYFCAGEDYAKLLKKWGCFK